MTTASNHTSQPKKSQQTPKNAFRRSPYREQTHVIRVPESLLPEVQKMLERCKRGVSNLVVVKR